MDNSTEQDNKLNILVFDNGTTSRKWRFDGIAERLNAQTKHEMYVTSHKDWNGKVVGANLVILEMLTGPHIVDACHAQGAKVIYEADDAVIDSYGRERKNLMHIGDSWRTNAIETIKRCDAITVTNKILADNYRRFTDKPIHILPNYIDYNWYGRERLRISRTTDEIRIGWFGSRGHHEDLRMISVAIGKVLEKYPKAKFVYCGYGGMSSNRLVTEVGWGEDVFKEIPRERREFYIAAPEDFWPTKHKTLDLDIGICPLIDDYFNHCKTPIKWIEFSMLNTPVVCSRPVYGEHPLGAGSTVQHGVTGFIADNEYDWVGYLSYLIEHPEARVLMAREAKRVVERDWSLDAHWREFLSVWEKVAFS